LRSKATTPNSGATSRFGLRINEYGRKTLELVVGDAAPPLHHALAFAQHLLISWVVAIPLLWLLAKVDDRRTRVLVGTLYGAAFYAVVNAWALPLYFGDPTPWTLGMETVYPSLTIHLVYGVVIGALARGRLNTQIPTHAGFIVRDEDMS
jgi:hypothetical protein